MNVTPGLLPRGTGVPGVTVVPLSETLPRSTELKRICVRTFGGLDAETIKRFFTAVEAEAKPSEGTLG